jgi:hypothetical protein
MKFKYYITFFYLLTCFSAFSQIINVERFRTDLDTSKLWLGNAGLGLAIKKQQNSIYTFNSNLNLVYMSQKHAYTSINYFKLIRQENENLLSEGYAHGRINFFRRKKLSYETFVQYQYDQGRGLTFRSLYGGSLRFTLLSSQNTNLAVNSGVMYEKENWKGEVLRFQVDSGYAESIFVKSTTNITARVNLSKTVSLFMVGYYQARPDYFLYPRLIADLQFQFKINKYLAFNTRFSSTYDALPLIEGNSFLYELNNSLLITFKP